MKQKALIILFLGINFFAVQAQNPIDSLTRLINTSKANSHQKAGLLFQLADLQYNSNQIAGLRETIEKTREITTALDDPCLNANLELLEAKELYLLRALKESRWKSKSIIAYARKNNCAKAEIDALLYLVNINVRNSNRDSCLIFINRAKNKAAEINDQHRIVYANRLLGVYYLKKNQYKKSRMILDSVAKALLAYNDYLKIGNAYSNIAESYYLESKYDSALLFASKAEPYLIKGYGNYALAANYNMIAIINKSTGRIDKAIDVYFKGLKIAEDYNITSLQNIFWYNLGNCYYILNARDKAAENFKLCLNLARQNNDTSSMVYSLSALGNVALEEDDNNAANDYLLESMKLALLSNDTYMLSFLSSSIAKLKINQQKYNEAQAYLDRAYNYDRILNSPESSINTKIIQAQLFAETQRTQKAIELLLLILDEAQKIQSVENYRYSLETLSEVYEKRKDYENALRFHRLIDQIEDSLNLTSTLEKFVNQELEFEQEKIERIQQLETEKATLEHQSKLKETRYIAILAIFTTVVFLVISFLFYFLSKSRSRRAKIFERKNRIIEKNSQELRVTVAKLRQLTDELDIANTTKSKLFSIIGYDLKNPFNVILGYANELMTDEPEDKETRQIFYQRIVKSSNQLVEMINTLLEWAMAQSGKIAYMPELVNITKVLNEVIDTSKINADKKSINIERDFDRDAEYMLVADKNMMVRIFHNLISNAIKFTQKNGQINVGWSKEQDQIRFFVKDNGIGMVPEDAADIFEKSLDMSKDGTQGEKGTGLGLSICKEFVNKHEGNIWAESELGKGSKFYFSIPI
ncbi:MAG: hypothetical protein JW857_03550 [Bacteroidales bacterium]|nr:hypothetical protein [Bacteroidales bacterium]